VLSEAKVLAEADRDTIYFDGIKKIEDAMSKINDEHPNSRIVVFVDDLDRCSPTRTLEVFESIKVFLDIKGFVYVIGLSYETISKLISAAYKESGISGEQYIRKLIQIPVIIPEWNEEDIYKLIDNLSSKVGSNYSAIIKNNKEVIARGIELNPREVKKFINNFIVANEIYSKDKSIKPKELLVVQALRVRWINFYRFLSSKEDFRKIVQEYIGKQQQERERTFNYHKGYIAKEYEQVLSDFISKPELWQLWDFLDKEKETILNIKQWGAYRRAAGIDISSDKLTPLLASKFVELLPIVTSMIPGLAGAFSEQQLKTLIKLQEQKKLGIGKDANS
jgi:KAP family P-loop domain